MKQIIFKTIMLLVVVTPFSCKIDSNKITSTNETTLRQEKQQVTIVFLADRSQSFINQYQAPNPDIFSPLMQKINHDFTVCFYYGCISDYSNRTLIRYFAPQRITDTEPTECGNNPWLDSAENAPAPVSLTTSDTNWSFFVREIQERMSTPASNASDVSNALKRALLVFNEQTERPQTRKILIVCSDFKDSFQELPSIPSDVEIITIGVLPDDNSVEKKLHTEKIEKFENVNSAIQYIFSTF